MRNDVVEINAVEAVLLLPLLLPRSVPLASCMGGWNRRNGSWRVGGERSLGGVFARGRGSRVRSYFAVVDIGLILFALP